MFIRKQTYDKLNQMVDSAVGGTFRESDYDETELSKLEVKWKRFLASSKQSSDRVEEERNKIQELLSDISHQTKTPLANIMLYSQLLKERCLDEESGALVEEIFTQSKKLEELIRFLVKTSRLETGTFKLEPCKQEIAELVGECEKQIEGKRRLKDIRLDRRTDSGTERIEARFDFRWTQEAFLNILDNAVKYSPRGGKISVEIGETENFVRLSVSDEGAGIPEEEIPLIFKRFYRGKQADREEGVGIGLYLSRQIVEEQNGYIRVKSKQGEGSCFEMYLPKG
ncbi:MAG: HAMP domain-containing histidine kinase [Alistipes sp.]|nr:HAMP domain-containing histidine kinase [Alistipes sp.]